MSAHPLGLHLHLVATGPTLRFVLWFERPASPHAFQRFKGFERDVPFDHPNALAHKQRPAWLPTSFAPLACFVTVPRLGSYLPVPLPGLITAWELSGFKTASRTLNASPYRVPAWVVPVGLSLLPLRKLLHDWSLRHGPGFVAPQAAVVRDVLDELHRRLAEGPLLPSVGPGPTAWDAPPGAPSAAWADPKSALVWTAPVSLAELHHFDAALRGAAHLPASRADAFDRRLREPVTWTSEVVPTRLANFLLELFGAAVDRAHAAPAGVDATALRVAATTAPGRALHRDHGSCLAPRHPIFLPPPAPKDHLHARLHPLDAREGSDDAWELELGVVSPANAFLPLETVAADGRLTHAAIEHADEVFFRAATIVERDWRAVLGWQPSRLTSPELLTGRCRLDAAAGLALLERSPLKGDPHELSRWLDELGLDGRAREYNALTLAPTSRGPARLRVLWNLSDDAEPSLHASRFVPSLELLVGDDALPPEDAARLLADATAAFVRVHGRVVARADLLAAYELWQARDKVLRRLDATRGLPWSKAVELDDQWEGERTDARTETVFAARWEAFLASLRDGAGVPRRVPPPGFRGTLRPYQLRGLSWMAFVVERGFGACLADDMGLGKTVQVLALLALRRASPSAAPGRPALVICPTAVVRNWAREAARFTPGLRVAVHQGAGRPADPSAFAKAAADADVVVTSYPLLRRDAALFESTAWGVLVADEAQNLKNPDALQTRVVRTLAADAKLCLTGTPVENRLRDLWSLYDVALPGLLGGATRFARTFLSPIRGGDARAMERLTKRVGPFLLRRTKRDPGIAVDLPPKQEQDEWCDLTREQVALYRAMTDATLEGIAGKDGVTRRAHILAALTRFKQICNHPESFQRDRPDRLFGRSGKLDRCMELVGELLDEEQRVLVFTQFTEMGMLLQRALEERFDVAADFYHGGLSARDRDAVLAAFGEPDGPPVLIVSLRAGGTGLNLTAASAVIHYDRWWNPAVEDQATDRAHRIGQTRKVNVYKFVTRATLEERVVTLLESKRGLAAKVLAASDESWITELDDRSLREFLTLGETEEET